MKSGNADEITIKHEDQSLKVELKNEEKEDGDDDDVTFLSKNRKIKKIRQKN